MKRLQLPILALIFLSLLSNSQAISIKSLSKEILSGIKEKNYNQIAVMKFSYTEKDLKNVSILIQERLITSLVKTNQVSVIDRDHLSKITKEMERKQLGILDKKTTKHLGKILGIDAFVTGTIHRVNHNRIEINSRLIDIESAQIVKVSSIQVKPENNNLINPITPVNGNIHGKAIVQMAILLDTSSSMNGLIEQTKTQLWNIINELSSSEQYGKNPDVEIALYEYGNSRLSKQEGYIRQVLPFTGDLDLVSESLFSLTTNGGYEFCGSVIRDAVQGLNWKEHKDVYKVIFIAGNEPFTQGPVSYQNSINEARRKGIFVNTIFCGYRQQGMATGWLTGATIGKGEYMNINQNIRRVALVTPHDNKILQLGKKINDTFIPYGKEGEMAIKRQEIQDTNATRLKASGAGVQRSLFKAKKQYNKSNWDIINLYQNKKIKLSEIDRKKLPRNLQSMDDATLEKYIIKKARQRKDIQNRIKSLNSKRNAYVKKSGKNMPKNELSSLMKSSIRKQASGLNFKFK